MADYQATPRFCVNTNGGKWNATNNRSNGQLLERNSVAVITMNGN